MKQRVRGLLPWLGPALGAALVPLACHAGRSASAEPLPLEALHELAEARRIQRQAGPDWRAAASAAAGRAAQLAPGWVAPRRFLDDMLREELRAPTALALRREELERSPQDAGCAYLTGRLEGRAGRARIEAAVRLDPALSWARHGSAWNRFLDGDARGALANGRAALGRARGSYEKATFAIALARYRLALDEPEEAIELLEGLLGSGELEPLDQVDCQAWLARAELAASDAELVERGFWRVLELFERDDVGAEEREQLGSDLLANLGRVAHPEALAELESTLARSPWPGSDVLRARVLLERGATGLAGALLAGAEGVSPSPVTRALALEHGDAAGAIEAWRAELPGRLLQPDGLPREPALRALVLASRATAEPGGAVRFGEALLAAGWFDETRGWARALVRLDPAAALELDGRAAAGRALLGGILGLLERVDSGRKAVLPAAPAPAEPRSEARGASGGHTGARRIESLDELLTAMEPLFLRQRGDGGALDLVAGSPRLSYGGLATVIHPGPTFSAQDEEAGRGRAGEPVPGLAAELARIGRFGLFGEATGGGGPDGTVLRKLGSEWRSGEHLGVPFAGLVVWCEGTDVPSRPGRRGSPVSGAALHEGYWIDVAGVRRELERLRALARDFGEREPGELERLLLQRGPRVPAGSGRDECARWLAPLGEGERVYLALLRERAGAPVELDELLDVTERHEQGHLTDRTRFLPLARNWWKAFGFALRAGLSPSAIARSLEYRAQLVALCTAADPRLALADCLGAADEQGGVLPHGEAYRELVEDLLRLAAERVDRFPALDPAHYLVYQLHFLAAEEVRALALELAARRRMVAD
jgi:hypothetical protein